MKLLSFDQSTTHSGWAVFLNDQYDHSGVIDKHQIKDSELRFKEMYVIRYSILHIENKN